MPVFTRTDEAYHPHATLPFKERPVTHAPDQSRRPRYVLVTKDGMDTVHRDPGESCNLDDTSVDTEIDRRSAAAMLANGSAQACQHCAPDRAAE
jgi:hypothetical protein